MYLTCLFSVCVCVCTYIWDMGEGGGGVMGDALWDLKKYVFQRTGLCHLYAVLSLVSVYSIPYCICFGYC